MEPDEIDNAQTLWDLAAVLSESYDARVEISRRYQHCQERDKVFYDEQLLRKNNPALQDAWEKYQLILQIVEK